MTNRPISAIDHLDTIPPASHESEDNTYTDAYLIQTLQALQQELDRAPTVLDVRNLGEILPDVSTYERRFGSWIEALQAAGIEGAHNRSDETILRQLARLASCLDRAPTKREVDADDTTASSGLYRNRFGSFSRAVEAALALTNSDTLET
ncbi:MAG TPA: hypothetical protein PKD28_02560 [Candidatus Saccharibacteria bacterium]|nr:hypothetical protein [Candidatus Saccharibacteria bacterium]